MAFTNVAIVHGHRNIVICRDGWDVPFEWDFHRDFMGPFMDFYDG